MASAQMPGHRSARLADDAATAALYATHPRRKASVREAPTTKAPAPDTPYLNARATGGASNLSAASAGAALAHAKQNPVEVWRPAGRFPDAEKAAWHVRDFTSPEVPQPSTQYSAEGLGAAIIAVREQRRLSSPTQTRHKHEISVDHSHAAGGGHAQDKARRAATGAYANRQRADSAPSEPVVTSEAPYALSAAGASHRVRIEDEGPLGHLDNAMEASRIQHVANANARMYTSSPPVASEVEERNHRNSLRAAALSMAKDMYDVSGPKGESGNIDPAIYAAQEGQNRLQYRNTVSGAMGTTAHKALALQDAAQKRAAEKLARMRNEHVELQQYYGTAPQPQRSRLTTRRKRTSSDVDVNQTDAEQSRHIRNQMTSLRSKMDKVDVQRQKDRDLLMEAARRNVDATIQDMEMKLYNDYGRAPPSMQKQWDEAARERVRQETEVAEASGARENRVNIGAEHYMDMADVEAVARSRVQPALDEITDQAEVRRAQELEARLDAEEKQRQTELEKEREASLRAVERKGGSSTPNRHFGSLINWMSFLTAKTQSEKKEGKRLSFLLFRKKSKKNRGRKSEEQKEDIRQEPTDDVPAKDKQTTEPAAEDETEFKAKGKTEGQAAAPVASAPESATVSRQVTAEEATSEPPTPETPGAGTVFAAAPASSTAAPVRLVTSGPSEKYEDHDAVRVPQRDAAATSGISDMHIVRPITSPRADSKLKTWFRDRLIRRNSGTQPVYPHQPGPEFQTDSEVGFTGGAALTGRGEGRGAALSSHPVTGDDLDQSGSNHNGTFLEVTKTTTEDSNSSKPGQNGNGKRQRLRKSFMNTISRGSQGPKTNGATNDGHSRQSSTAASETKVTGTGDIQGLRNSATEQGLAAPPILGQTASTGRESRFSEDL
ncbi:hypothetical protein N7532_010439 [Penicillium argentinense]|uniref:Eisosome protein 1 n=1 Tax=Penicillium argentinense TaxID=1131581 RepID=A0A9W9EPM0_9EURO|nr:uncharacterized protein N7532_010439 [Penicillium argentinense]KAJ5085668.1 hypothetical protein N7532_010439 [Penicillium argentinense]